MIGVVYQISNTINQKVYIGSSSHNRGITHRWTQHTRALNAKQHHSIILQRAWDKYGKESFVFEILLYCDPENCLWYEQMFLDHLKPEYNIAKIAGSPKGIKHTVCSKLNMSLAHRGKYIGMKNPAAKLCDHTVRVIRRAFDRGVNRDSIARKFNISRRHVYRVAKQANWSHIS